MEALISLQWVLWGLTVVMLGSCLVAIYLQRDRRRIGRKSHPA
jgi:hypothetical protein